jgi:hypothetical protein
MAALCPLLPRLTRLARPFHPHLPRLVRTMSKRARSPSPVAGGAAGLTTKKPKTKEAQAVHRKIASAEAAARVDAAPPLYKLMEAMKAAPAAAEKGAAACYWMRMEDLRSKWLALCTAWLLLTPCSI